MLMDWTVSSRMSALDSINPSLTRYGRRDPAPVLPLREEPDLLSWLEASGRLVADEESGSPEVSTVEEEELSALMGEKEDYNNADEQKMSTVAEFTVEKSAQCVALDDPDHASQSVLSAGQPSSEDPTQMDSFPP